MSRKHLLTSILVAAAVAACGGASNQGTTPNGTSGKAAATIRGIVGKSKGKRATHVVAMAKVKGKKSPEPIRVKVRDDGSYELPVYVGYTWTIVYEADGRKIGAASFPNKSGKPSYSFNLSDKTTIVNQYFDLGVYEPADGYWFEVEHSPYEYYDSDGDGQTDWLDEDDDNDGTFDVDDLDDDGDGFDDLAEDFDTDNDGELDFFDADDDGDGIDDLQDNDDDGDGIDDAQDMDDDYDDADDDGVADEFDNDDDGDGVSDEQDQDDDGDGVNDSEDHEEHFDGDQYGNDDGGGDHEQMNEPDGDAHDGMGDNDGYDHGDGGGDHNDDGNGGGGGDNGGDDSND